MRKLYILLFTLVAVCCLAGCTRENAEQTTGNGDVIIRLEVDGLETKSAASSDENYVDNLQLLVFKDVNTAPAKYLAPAITPGEGPFEQTYATLTAFGGFSEAELNDAVIFAVANYATNLSSATSLADAKSKVVNADGFLDDTAEGWKVKATPRFVMTAQGGFVMGTGSDAGKAVASLTLRRLASKVSIQITYASVDPENPIVTEDEANKTKTVWTPMTEGNVRVYLSNAVNNGKLEGNADTPGLFTYADNHPEGEGTLSSSAFYTYPTTWASDSDNAPFIKIIQPWSYKTIKYEGTSASPTNPVVIDQNVVELYYKVVFPGITSLAANTWYRPTVTLNVLGGESNRNMQELSTTGFDILPWGTVSSGAGGLSPIVIEPAKYIAVERENTIVNHGGTVSINYVASGPTTLTVERIYKTIFTDDDKNVEREIYPTKHPSINDLYSASWFTKTYGSDPERPKEGLISLNHELSSNFNDTNFSSRPYIYQLKLHLDGESTDLDKTFYIIQNPVLLVDVEKKSSGWVSINGQDSNNAYTSVNTTGVIVSDNYYVDGYQPRASSSYTKPYSVLPGGTSSSGRFIYVKWYNSTIPTYRNGVNNLGTLATYDYLAAASKNKCQWLVSIIPSSASGIFIMDPRLNLSLPANSSNDLNKIINQYSTTYNQGTIKDGSPLSANATDVDNIKNYRPTKKDDVSNVVAPKYMIASSYGKTIGINYMAAVLRCAAYQEDGYPAGRWRLPTESELKYAIEISKKGTIPNLFDGNYWASSGRYYDGSDWHDSPSGSQEKNGMTAYIGNLSIGARCVYDIWYWGADEVAALKTSYFNDNPSSPTYSTDITHPQYIWSGYGYTSK